jgi:hypothetical protein
VELGLISQRRREKPYGPGPDNNYTSGSGKKSRWGRKQRDSGYTNGGLEAQKRQPDTLPQHSTPGDMRDSYATDTTAVGHEQPIQNKYAAPAAAAPTTQQTHPAHIGTSGQTGYTTQPTTHTGYASQPASAQYASQQPTYAQQVQSATHTTHSPFAGGAEMPGENYRTYNPARSDAY